MTFADCQAMHIFQENLYYVAAALEANLDVFRICKDNYPGYGSHRNTEATSASILLYMRQTIFHLGNIKKMGTQSRQAADLVSICKSCTYRVPFYKLRIRVQ